MGLSCDCYVDAEWFYEGPDDYEVLSTKRGRRCCSCNKLIKVGEIVTKHTCWRSPTPFSIEESIYGDEVPMAPKYHCEECADIEFSLLELGFCIVLGDEMRELSRQYAEDYVGKN